MLKRKRCVHKENTSILTPFKISLPNSLGFAAFGIRKRTEAYTLGLKAPPPLLSVKYMLFRGFHDPTDADHPPPIL